MGGGHGNQMGGPQGAMGGMGGMGGYPQPNMGGYPQPNMSGMSLDGHNINNDQQDQDGNPQVSSQLTHEVYCKRDSFVIWSSREKSGRCATQSNAHPVRRKTTSSNTVRSSIFPSCVGLVRRPFKRL